MHYSQESIICYFNQQNMNTLSEMHMNSEEIRENVKLNIAINPFQQQIDDRWMEFKILGKNIQPRSYHISVIYGSYMYIQGGYDVDKGFLSDFYRLQLENQGDGFKWQRLSEDVPNYPGRLKSHSAVVHKTTMVVFGGQLHDGQGSNLTYIYDFIKGTWEKVKPSADLPKLDSHSAFVVEDTMYIYGGFKDQEAEYSANIYALDLKTRTWSLFYQQDSKQGVFPQARSNLGLVVLNNELWIFGGINRNGTLNDMWKFDMARKTWKEINGANPPEPRRSHTMVIHEDYFYVFGGIQDVTKQKNDIYLFSPAEQKWVKIHNSSNLVYECSPTIKQNRSSEKKKAHSPHRHKGSDNYLSLMSVNNVANPSSIQVPRQKTNLSSTQPSKQDIMKRIIQQQRHKKFRQRKHQLLKQFSDLKPNNPKRKLSPTSENMLKTLQLIGDQEHSKKILHQEVVYDPTRKYILGKRPCARDAHTSVVYNDRMLIFGGDRHLMSFSDIYYFDLKKGLESKKIYEMRHPAE